MSTLPYSDASRGPPPGEKTLVQASIRRYRQAWSLMGVNDMLATVGSS
jgi:hypothetical protein